MCRALTSVPAPPPVAVAPPPGALVGDGDRQRTADLLAEAAGAGYLGLAELDERLANTWAARTGADLAVVVADLPPQLVRARQRREAAERARRLARESLGPHLRSYLGVMALLVAIWLTVGVLAGAWYPWPVWPALGWGIGVAGHARAALGTRSPHPA